LNGPLRDFIKVRLARGKPSEEDVEPLGEELSLEQLGEHRWLDDAVWSSPGEDVLEGGHVLGGRADFESIAEKGAKFREDRFEDEGVPFEGGEDLQKDMIKSSQRDVSREKEKD
jgi:hypothetical protein